MGTRSRLVQTLFALMVLSLVGCEKNIWSFTAPSESDEGLIAEGRELLNEGKFEEAAEKFAEAIQENPNSSDARYYHAKAVLHGSGFNALTLGNTLTDESGYETHLPFSDWSTDSANTMYQVNNTIIDDLTPIYDMETTGNFTATDIEMDLTISSTVSGILSFRDTNSDGAINDSDINLVVFLNSDGELALEDLEEVEAEDINTMITNVDSLIGNAGDLLTNILGDTSESGFDTQTLDSLISDMTETADYYYVNTGESGNPGEGDNDGDWDVTSDDTNGNGVPDSDWDGPTQDDNEDGNPYFDPEPNVDEECLNGEDDDLDGLTDEDCGVCP